MVETFREFCSMLLGANIHMYTDHKNFTHKLSQYVTQHVLHWCKGPDNVLADTLSRLPSSMANALSSTSSSTPAKLPPSPPLEKFTEALTFIDNLELAECLAEMPLSNRQPAGPHNDVVPDLYHDCLLFHNDLIHNRTYPFILLPFITTNNMTPGYMTSLLMINVSTSKALAPLTLFAITLRHLLLPVCPLLIGRLLFHPTCSDPLSIGTTRPLLMPLAWTTLKLLSNAHLIIPRSVTPAAPSSPTALFLPWFLPPTNLMDIWLLVMLLSFLGAKFMLIVLDLGKYPFPTTRPFSFTHLRALTLLLTLLKSFIFMAHQWLRK